MNITKYAHACLVVDEQGQKIVIDPGGFTPAFGDIQNIVAVVITHAHGDHFNAAHLAAIAEANPTVQVFSTPEVAAQIDSIPITAVKAAETHTVGPFSLRFFGEQHALIHESIPRIQNIGVMVNDTLYYPGDSFTTPGDARVGALALPVSAPWMKIGEAIDFLQAVQPRLCFATHNAVLSESGQAIVDNILSQASAAQNVVYHSLKPGQSLVL